MWEIKNEKDIIKRKIQRVEFKQRRKITIRENKYTQDKEK